MSYKISVVMTSYNGSHYIVEQLESIRAQSHQVDEVIICDDCSTDETFKIICSYIEKNKLANWLAYENDTNLGWMRNFYKAVSLCSGDIIFFSDQDDIWLPDKVELLSNLMKQYDADAAYGGYRIIDHNGALVTDGANSKRHWSERIWVQRFDKKFNTIITLGCRMCISREIADLYLTLNEPDNGHDSQCGRLALLKKGIVTVDVPVINYRIHGLNTSGVSNQGSYGYSTLEKRVSGINENIKWLDKLCQAAGLSDMQRDVVRSTSKMQQERYEYLSGLCGKKLLDLWKYHSYYSGIGMLIGDYAYKHGLNRELGDIRYKTGRTFRI